jgi:hypothetical protein
MVDCDGAVQCGVITVAILKLCAINGRRQIIVPSWDFCARIVAFVSSVRCIRQHARVNTGAREFRALRSAEQDIRTKTKSPAEPGF